MISENEMKIGERVPFNVLDNEDATVIPKTGSEIRDIAKANREKQVNNLLETMQGPLKNEQQNKISYRKWVLVGYLSYFILITVAVFTIIFIFSNSKKGITNAEAKICQILIAGLFVNLISLAVVIFKYLFDDKNSLMKDVIQLMVETLREK